MTVAWAEVRVSVQNGAEEPNGSLVAKGKAGEGSGPVEPWQQTC